MLIGRIEKEGPIISSGRDTTVTLIIQVLFFTTPRPTVINFRMTWLCKEVASISIVEIPGDLCTWQLVCPAKCRYSIAIAFNLTVWRDSLSCQQKYPLQLVFSLSDLIYGSSLITLRNCLRIILIFISKLMTVSQKQITTELFVNIFVRKKSNYHCLNVDITFQDIFPLYIQT